VVEVDQAEILSEKSGTRQSPCRRAIQSGLVASLDHLVGAGEDRLRDRQAERFRGLQVDDELEFIGATTGKSADLAPFRSWPL
jgi:hypothetical protein